MAPVAAIIDTAGKIHTTIALCACSRAEGFFLPAGQGDIKSVLYR